MSQARRITSIALSTLAAATGAALAPTAAHATGTTGKIYVDNAPGQGCSDTAVGAGSRTTPFCSINAAVAIAAPGADVIVSGDSTVGYAVPAPVTPPSGTPDAPIIIEAASGSVAVGPGFDVITMFDLDNVHDVVVKGFSLGGAYGVSAVGASRVTISGNTTGVVKLTNSTDAVVTGNLLSIGIEVAGSTDTTITDNILTGPGGGPLLDVSDSPHTKIVNNTIPYGELALKGVSHDSVIENNILAESLGVSADSVSGTTADYNLYRPGTWIGWGSQSFQTQTAFTAATGQGAHDLNTDPKLGYDGSYPGWTQLLPGSPAIDSADPAAPGIPVTDFRGSVPIAYPGVTGTSNRDRGAMESDGLGTVTLVPANVTEPAAYRSRSFTAKQDGDLWGTGLSYVFDFGDGVRSAPQSSPSASHTYAADGDYTVTVTVTDQQGRSRTTRIGVVVLPRSRPDIVIASEPITAQGNFAVEAQSPQGLNVYPPSGQYFVDWGDGSAVSQLVGHGARTLDAGHVYPAGTSSPTVTISLIDDAGWVWKWTYNSGTDAQTPKVSNPPLQGGWILPTTSPGGPTGGGPTGGGPTGGGPAGGGPTGGGPSTPPPGTPAAHVVQRLGGSDRYETGRVVSQAQWRNGKAAAVVLARGDKAPDALAGVPLAARKGGPLLLTDPTALDRATRAEIDRVLGGPATKKPVYILGGSGAVSPVIERELREAGYTVTRLSGGDRFGTALAVAGQFSDAREAIVATGLDFPDALASGPLGALRGAPVLLSNGPQLDPATAAYLKGRQTIDAVGGAAVKAVAGLRPAGKTVHELAGRDRFQTAQAVAGAVTSTIGHTPTGAGVAYAFNFPDALTGGAFAATAGQPLLLTDRATADPGLLSALHGWGGTLTTVEIFGGTSVISRGVQEEIARTIGGVEH